MFSNPLLLAGLVLAILLSAVGAYTYIDRTAYKRGQQDCQLAVQKANDLAVKENKTVQQEESREISKITPEIKKQQDYYTRLEKQIKDKIEKESKSPVPTCPAKLSSDGLRLFNDAIRGKEPAT